MQQKTEKVRTSFGFKKKAVAVAVLTAAVGLSVGSASPAYGEPFAAPMAADSTERKALNDKGIIFFNEDVEVPSEGSIAVESAAAEAAEPQPAPVTPPPFPGGSDALAVAYSYIGTPYVSMAAGPGGFDCSGLVMFSFAQVGVSLPHSADQIGSMGTIIDESQAVPGDLVWWPGQHIGFWVAPGQMLDAPVPGQTVGVHNMWGSPVIVRL